MGSLSDLLRVYRDLLVRFLFHEHISRVVAVQELVFLPFNPHYFYGFTCSEPVLNHLPSLQILELRADECSPVSRVHVLEFDDRPQFIIVHLDYKTGPEISS